MSYRPPSPDYKSRRYSPSRQTSHSPPSTRRPPIFPPRNDDPPRSREGYHSRYEYSPPPRRYSPSPPRRYGGRDRSPPRGGRFSPPPDRLDRSPPRRPYSPPGQHSPPRRPRSRSPVRRRNEPVFAPVSSYRAPSTDDGARGRQSQRPSPQRAMAADREELRATPISAPSEQWQRGRDLNELRPIQPTVKRSAVGMSEPSIDVVFIGIDDELDENDLIGYLRIEHRALVDAVKIIRRPSADGRSKNLAFVTFASLAGAEDFVDNNSGGIIMPALYSRSDPKKVRIDFAKPQPIVSHIPKQSARIPHDGMRDVGPMGAGNRVLVLRQLDAGTRGDAVIRRISEEIAKMLSRAGQEGLAAQAIHRVVTIVDKVEGQSWGICFVELESSELAAALLSYLISPHTQPSGFRISGIPVAASFASASSFIPSTDPQYAVRPAQRGGIGSETPDSWCSYWHPQGGAAETIPPGNSTIGKISDQLRDFLGHLAGSTPLAGAAVMNSALLGRTGILPIKLAKKKKDEPMPTRNVLEDEVVEDKDSQLLSRTKGTNIVLPQAGRKIAKNINKWNSKQSELAKPSTPAKVMSEANQVIVAAPEDLTDVTTMSTTGKVACLLCQRQFNSEEMLRKHVSQSGLHKARLFLRGSILTYADLVFFFHASILHSNKQTNLLDPTIVAAGRQRKTAAMTEYRDRAAERRKAFNQPDKPGWINPEKKRKYADAPAAPVLPEPVIEPGKDESNVGNQLLAKMGWKSGTGLGAEGSGRVEPIKVQQFAERAGLGASQGHAAGSWTGSGGRAQQAHDVSQARYRASGA